MAGYDHPTTTTKGASAPPSCTPSSSVITGYARDMRQWSQDLMFRLETMKSRRIRGPPICHGELPDYYREAAIISTFWPREPLPLFPCLFSALAGEGVLVVTFPFFSEPKTRTQASGVCRYEVDIEAPGSMTNRLNHRITRVIKDKADFPGHMKGQVRELISFFAPGFGLL